MDRKISTLQYNNWTVYECFNNRFTDDFGSLYMHLTSITIDDRPPPHKRARYTPDLLPAAISIASENSVSTLTTPFYSLDILPTDGPSTLHAMNKDMPLGVGVRKGYCCRKHVRKIYYKKTRFYCSICSDKNNVFYYFYGFSRISSETRTCFLEYQHYMSTFSS